MTGQVYRHKVKGRLQLVGKLAPALRCPSSPVQQEEQGTRTLLDQTPLQLLGDNAPLPSR